MLPTTQQCQESNGLPTWWEISSSWHISACFFWPTFNVVVGNHDEIPKDRTIQVNFESFHLGLGFSEPEDTVMAALSTAFKIKMEGTKAYKNQISGSILYIEVRDTACLPIEFITGYHASLSLGYRGNTSQLVITYVHYFFQKRTSLT